ncbi:MAG: hypothetical protein V3V05_09880 [Pontiella sp.]
MATENLGWGYSKILGELKNLGIRIGRTTIQDILKREGHYPVPDKAKRIRPVTGNNLLVPIWRPWLPAIFSANRFLHGEAGLMPMSWYLSTSVAEKFS